MPLDDTIYTFEKLKSYPHLIHGVSTRFFGSMRMSKPEFEKSFQNFTQAMGISVDDVVLMDQRHTANVVLVGREERGTKIPETDGLITSASDTFLAVVTGDCTPLLLYDPKQNVVGAVHAGWRGLYGEVIGEAIDRMIEEGSKSEDIIACLGPCICGKCYEFGQDIVDTFIEKFKNTHGDPLPYITARDGNVYVNQRAFARVQLIQSGVLEKNIEISEICTKENLDMFYSFRAEGKETFGLFMSLIGMK